MKRHPALLAIIAMLLALLALLLFRSCNNKADCDTCCQGYTGTVTNSQSLALLATDHFISKDSILAWQARWDINKGGTNKDSIIGTGKILGSTHSFNRYIIKAIICNDSCIGLRVLTGQSADLKIHVILVGIKPDYTNLYIPDGGYFKNIKTNTFNYKGLNKISEPTMALPNPPTGGSGDLGGAEHEMNP